MVSPARTLEGVDGQLAPRRPTLGVAVICLGVPGLIAVLFSALAPALPSIAAEYGQGGDGALIAQLVFSLAAVMMIVGAVSAGLLAELVGRRRILIAGSLIFAIAGVGGMVAPNLAWLAATRAIVGLVAGMMLTASYATIGEHYEGDARERMLGFVSFFSGSCAVILQLVGGMLIDALGWRAMFGLFALSLILLPAAIVSLPRGRSARQIIAGGWSQVLSLWPLYGLLCIYTMLIYMTTLQSPFLLGSRGVTSATEIGALLSITSVFGALGSFAYGYIRRAMGFAGILAFASFAGGFGLTLAGLVPGREIYIVAAIAIGMAVGIIEPNIASETMRRTPERLHDRAMGINIGAMFLGQFLNPLVMGPLRMGWGIADAFVIAGVGFVAAGLLFVVGARRAPGRHVAA